MGLNNDIGLVETESEFGEWPGAHTHQEFPGVSPCPLDTHTQYCNQINQINEPFSLPEEFSIPVNEEWAIFI